MALSDQATYSRLGVFVSILIARHCFPLQSFITDVPISSILKAREDVKEGKFQNLYILVCAKSRTTRILDGRNSQKYLHPT